MNEELPIIVNGWTILAHPLFIAQVEELSTKVEFLKVKDPKNYQSKNATKRLAAIIKLGLSVIPANPEDPSFRQGNTMGKTNKHWFRAKFFQQYRLFFRFDQNSKIIILAWVNDESSKRAYSSKSDAYAVFEKMVSNGKPPGTWDDLLAEAKHPDLGC